MMVGKRSIVRQLAPLCLVLFCWACNEAKYLGPGQALYSGNTVKVESSVPITKKQIKAVTGELETLLRPKLNAKILGWRYKLWIYNIAGTPKKSKGFKHWLKYKVGEPPVLATPTLIDKNREIMQNHLENKGYFRDTVVTDTKVRNKHLVAMYTPQIGWQYTIRKLWFYSDSDALSHRIDTSMRHTLLHKGDPFDLDMVKNERTRIDSRLKNKGFYFFSPDYLHYDVDTTVGNHQLDMKMSIKEETPDVARNLYRINKVVVYAQYDIRGDTSLKDAYTTPEGFHILDTAHYLRPIVFRRTLVFKPGNIYKRDDHSLSLNRLVSLGVFKFVKARFEPANDNDTNSLLNAYYYLTPSLKRSIQFEASALTRSDNTTGSEASISWKNRNLMRGAELFTASLYGGLEEQTIGGGVKVATHRAGVDLNLYIPRIISPFNLNTSSAFVPKTKIEAGYDIFARSDEYTLTSARASFGYVFKNRVTSENTITVLGINYVRPTNISPTYQQLLDTNITQARAIERQFIIGPSYNFNYNSQARPNHRMNNFYFNGNVDLSNNLLGIFQGADINKGKQKEIFNVPYAQYVRLEADFRHYLSFSQYSMLVSRVTGGIGYSYGNSSTMPFIKEFFAGGTNDIRSFRSRALGPGSYHIGDVNRAPVIPDQPGDIKLEANLEYRTKLFSIVRWAIFADAGNVWTLRSDTSRQGSVFTPHFLNDFAVGVGTGLRFDLTILVLRLDFAVPVRYPYSMNSNGSHWTFNKVTDISDMVLNLAIGYPF